MVTKVSETIYYIHDLDQAVEFYTQKLGWTLIEKLDWGWAQLSIDGTARVGLLTEAVWAAKNKEDGLPRPRIGLQTIAIEAEVARLRAAGVTCEDVKGEPGTMRAVNFTDLDGNEFFLWDDGQGKF
jgi:catechol 2,3-dioxygenase-like lactoylglutathione lyase family enzyme